MSKLLFTEVSADQQELVAGGRRYTSTGLSGSRNSNSQNYSVTQNNTNGDNASTITSQTLIYSYSLTFNFGTTPRVFPL